ncbi:SGNH/GDSL hydrolase family protein [Mesorhizobium sp. M0046]|uniref:SGNH/GDSL hydrolase family protein n=1 Tax=Mesorhizobium sp. M0046 TaxID=2956858 RepID=UPI003338BDD4
MGIYSTDLPLVAALDEVVGNVAIDGIQRSARQSMADHAVQIAADGPIADALTAEATARAAADTALDGRLTPLEAANLPARMTAAEAELADHETRIDSAESLIATGAKTPVAVSTLSTVNIPIASGVINGANIGGFVVSTGQLVVLAGQTAPAENGAYPVVAAGATARAPAFDTSAELLGATFAVTNGTVQGTVYAVRNTGAINVGVDAIVITHAYGTPGNPTQAEVTSARQGYVDLGANLTAMKASTSAIALQQDTVLMLEGLSVPAFKLAEAAGSVSPSVYRSYTFVLGDTIEHVVITRAAERGSLQLLHAGAGAAYTVNFDLNEGIVVSHSGANYVSSSITDLGSGWYECKAVVLVATGVTNNVQTRISAAGTLPYTGDGTSGLHVQSIVLRKQGFTTNLFPSSDPTNAAFTKQSITATATTVAPAQPVLVTIPPIVDDLDVIVRGRMTASKAVEPGVSGSPSTWQAKTVVAGDLIVWEVIAKRAERKRLNLFSNSAALIDCTFDLDLGTVAQSGAAVTGSSCTALGNGWFRCRVEATASASASSNWQHRIFKDTGTQPYVGDGVSGLYIQRSSFTLNGGANNFASAENLSSSAWSKSSGLTVVANAALYLGLLADGANIGADPYDDGSAALVGKKWTALGSSITIGAYYAPLLAGQTGMILTNLGVSGSALGLSTTAYPSYGMSAPIATMPTDADIVTLEPGPNAFGAQETPLGAFGDTTYATHYGSIWKAILDIRARAPSAKIIVFGVYSGGPGHATHRLGRTNGQGNTMDQFMKAEREVCQALGVKYVDISQSGLGYMTSTLYMGDELHPNAAGSLRYATYVAGSLRDMVRRGMFVN